MRILISEVNEDWQKELLAKGLAEHDLAFITEPLTPGIAGEYADTEVLSVFVGSQVDSEVINLMPKLKFISTRSTGFDHIDLQAAQARSIVVSNVPFYGENTVAEHTFALLLALARKLPQSFDRVEDAKFDYHGLRGWDLKGKKIGIIGGGHIGLHVARIARGFEMSVLVYDINPDPKLAREIGFDYSDWEQLLSSADVISLHVPLNEHTHHIINAKAFEQMKDGVYLLNTARGGLIDTDELIKALKSGKVAGAGLDVLEGEEFLKDELELLGKEEYQKQVLTLLEGHILMEMENVIVTPHNAFNSQEAVQRILQTTIENITSFARGEYLNRVGAT